MLSESKGKNIHDGDKIGKALTKYIADVLKYYKAYAKEILNIKNLDLEVLQAPKTKKGNKPPRADFIIETSNYIFIVECKNSLSLRTPLSKNEVKDLLPLLDSWGRMAGSFLQCLKSKENLTAEDIKDRKVFTLIVTNETVLGEAAAFCGFYNQDIFTKLGLRYGAMSIISVTQFENLVASGKLEAFAKECKKSADYNSENVEFLQVNRALNIGFKPYESDSSFWVRNGYDTIDNLD